MCRNQVLTPNLERLGTHCSLHWFQSFLKLVLHFVPHSMGGGHMLLAVLVLMLYPLPIVGGHGLWTISRRMGVIFCFDSWSWFHIPQCWGPWFVDHTCGPKVTPETGAVPVFLQPSEASGCMEHICFLRSCSWIVPGFEAAMRRFQRSVFGNHSDLQVAM